MASREFMRLTFGGASNDDKKASLSVGTGRDGSILLNCFAGCRTEDVCAALGIRIADLFPERNGNRHPERRITATYPYQDESSKLLFEVVRYEPKDFKQRGPDGNGG